MEGLVPALCDPNSPFALELAMCKQCIAQNDEIKTNLDPKFQQFLDYCDSIGSSIGGASSTTIPSEAQTSSIVHITQSSQQPTGTSSQIPPSATSPSTKSSKTSSFGPASTAISYTIPTSWLTISEIRKTTALDQLTGDPTLWTVIVDVTVTRADWTGFPQNASIQGILGI